jgi:maltose-binding protein MalE
MQAYLNPQGKKNIKLHTLLMKWRVIMKRLLIFTLVFALLISFVACAGRTEDDSSDSTTTQNTTTTTKVETTTTIENPFTEHLQLTYLVAFALGYEEGRWDELELEEKFNIDLKVWTIDAESSEQCTLMAAAGDWPDTGHVAAYSS